MTCNNDTTLKENDFFFKVIIPCMTFFLDQATRTFDHDIRKF